MLSRSPVSRLICVLSLCVLCWLYATRITLPSLPRTGPTKFGKYWLIEHLDEQLGKSKFHLLEQVTIANLLNRTLVLPNVGKSEIGLRLSNPFSYYYQMDSLKSLIPTISSTEFNILTTSININRTITAGLVFIRIDTCSNETLSLDSWNSVENTIFKTLSEKFIVNKLPPLCFLTSYGLNPPDLPDLIIKQLDALHNNTDIIVVIKISSLFLMDPKKLPVDLLKHNQTLIDMANKFSKTISPYLAIHWRMEGGDENGQVCAQTLFQTVANVSSKHYFKNIYFASDHTRPSERLLSNSFQESRPDQTIGYHEIMNKLKPLTFRNISYFSALTDSGSLSIVEKLICQESDFFLPGYVPCDRHGAYGREMVRYRQIISKKPWLYWSNPTQPYEPEKFYPP